MTATKIREVFVSGDTISLAWKTNAKRVVPLYCDGDGVSEYSHPVCRCGATCAKHVELADPDDIESESSYGVRFCCLECFVKAVIADSSGESEETVDEWEDELKGLPGPDEAPDELSSVFGMCEMEEAALCIIRQARNEQTWVTYLYPPDFNFDDMVCVGFASLVAFNWIECDEEGFHVTPSFVKKVMGDKTV